MKDVTVLFEDENLLILNKPAGLAVQGGKGIGISLDSLLANNYKNRPFLVHRLDKDTSGVIVTAKTRESAAACSAFFSDHRKGLKKTYLAFCKGILNEQGTINDKIINKGRELQAQTSYSRKGTMVLAGIGQEAPISLSLAELLPSTGRMHQIRRHLARLGHPILGDDKYGDFSFNKKLKKMLGIKRLYLHALAVYLPPPLITGGLAIFAPLPVYFRELIDRMGIILSTTTP